MEFVTFKNGPTVPLEPWLLAIYLDLRNIKLSASGETLRVVGPNGKPELSPEDKAAITRWKQHLLALVAYCSTDH